MTSNALTVEQYLEDLPDDRKAAMVRLRTIILQNLPKGFKEEMSYGMIGYVVPFEIYPSGYHCNPKLPLPFMSFASQKNSINFYHMMLYAEPSLHDWFVESYPKYCNQKLDMGKSCIRFKKIEHIPFDLIGELVKKICVEDWVKTYESKLKR